ncbi:LysE family transporter [Brooklawnia cerclae]|uniref:Threonine/homoserine/homoserine lactone efflux protein n=1 Tax=Brooklawnia cerclae TaxID=349934 RepID=A0ABX0SBR8_9ACTN|nr:LysE family transporter [Brooklawnia cerclae]NIH55465.1 threonine/homoserine/homoserine lactone efflux protein [Brooklawnia cerclae]
MGEAAIAGLIAGYAIAIPVGAIATLIIVAAAQHGWRVGVAAGLGAATADGLYAAVAITVGASLSPLIEAVANPLRWVAAGVLVLLGVSMIVQARRESEGVPGAPQRSPVRSYAAVLGMTIVNPATVIYFAALVAGSAYTVLDDTANRALFVVGAFIASASWQTTLALGGAVLGRYLTSPRGRRWTAVAGGSVVILLAVRTALGA